MIRRLLGVAALAAMLAAPAGAQDYAVRTVAQGLVHPWGLAFLPDGRMLVTERPGRVRLVEPDGAVSEPLAGAPNVYAAGQGGMLDIALDPDFAENRWVYISYAGSTATGAGPGGANTEVARARLVDGRFEDLEVVFRAKPKTPGTAHYGSRLLFLPDGTLLITLGDRYRYMQEAQNPGNHLGALVRIDPDGGIPADNPFVDSDDAMPDVYTYGHRNAQGLALHPETGIPWMHEHGPRGGGEVNILEPGANYGWPAITYGIDYSGAIISEETHAPGMEQPLVYWDPSIAPSGMAFYTGDRFPEWRGDLFIGALAGRHLRQLVLDGDHVVRQEELLTDLGERIRDVRDGPDGYLYLLTDNPQGRILRLEPR